MDSSSSQFISSRSIGVYDPMHQITMWEENFRSHGNSSASMSLIEEVDTKLNNQVWGASFQN